MARRRPSNSHSIHNEPQFTGRPARPDASEAKAARALREEVAGARDGEPGVESVYDEPDILPGRSDEPIDVDWSCSGCGYNLRGLPPGTRCPECGHIELYRPAPPSTGFAGHYQRAAARTTLISGWMLAAGAAFVAGVFATYGALLEFVSGPAARGGSLQLLLWEPFAEEALKLAPALLIVELRPWAFRVVGQLQLAALGGAAAFAVVTNVLYLYVSIPNPRLELVLWRWIVCSTLQIGCTAIAVRGVIAVWRRSRADLRRPRFGETVNAFVWAFAVHAAFNAALFAVRSAGFVF